MTNLLSVQNVSLQFESQLDKVTLSTIAFELDKGETLLLLGPSGCGKSTLTFCLNGLYPRELDGTMQGTILINGKKSTDYKPGELSKYVGVVFQDPETQFCMLTVEDEIAFGLENLCVPRREMDKKITDALTLVDLTEFRTSEIASLSGGQKQKLALACILALEPDLLILDEPTANLDPIASKELTKTIQRLKEQKNFSMIVIEHQLDGWMDLCDRSLLLNRNGEVFYDGSLREGIAKILPELTSQGIWLPKITQFVLEQQSNSNFIPLTMKEFEQGTQDWTPLNGNYTRSPNIDTKILIKANDLIWSKGNKQIIQHVSLNLYEQEFVAIVGANGSGKTSLSRILAGIQKPISGSIDVKGRPLTQWKEAYLRDEIGYVFQNPEHQFIMHTVFDEIAFGMRLRGMSEAEIRAKVDVILSICNLEQLENEHPFTLSQGQKRRLSVATMIVDNQQILLLDEPTFGQDAKSTEGLMDLLQERHEDGTTIVMITHDMEIVHDYTNRVIVMNQGTIAFDGHPAGLWKKPTSTLNAWQLETPVQVQMKEIAERKNRYVPTSP